MRLLLLLISVAFIGSVYFFIINENKLNLDQPEKRVALLSESSASTYQSKSHSAVKTSAVSSQTKDEIQVNTDMSEQDNLLLSAQGQHLMAALTSFWQQCSRQHNCEEMLIRQQSILDERRYQLLLNFTENQQEELGLMGASLISQDASLADKIANVKAIREQVWGEDAALLFQQQDDYYDYRLSLTDPDNKLNQTQNADDFIYEYNQLLIERADDLDNFALSSGTAKYEEALKLIPASMSDYEAERIKDELAAEYLTSHDQQAIADREKQLNQQTEEITDYQQGLNLLETTLANERATTKQALTDEDWLAYKADRLYQYRLAFFSS